MFSSSSFVLLLSSMFIVASELTSEESLTELAEYCGARAKLKVKDSISLALRRFPDAQTVEPATYMSLDCGSCSNISHEYVMKVTYKDGSVKNESWFVVAGCYIGDGEEDLLFDIGMHKLQ